MHAFVNVRVGLSARDLNSRGDVGHYRSKRSLRRTNFALWTMGFGGAEVTALTLAVMGIRRIPVPLQKDKCVQKKLSVNKSQSETIKMCVYLFVLLPCKALA